MSPEKMSFAGKVKSAAKVGFGQGKMEVGFGGQGEIEKGGERRVGERKERENEKLKECVKLASFFYL